MNEIDIDARAFLIKFQFQEPPLMLDDAKKYALIAIDCILQTNPTIKGNSTDFLTQIVQTKAYFYRLQDAIKKI